MALMTTLKQAMTRAENTAPPYTFEDGDDAPRVIPIPISLDDRLATLRSMEAALVAMEAERHRIDNEIADLKAQRKTHALTVWHEIEQSGVLMAISGEKRIAEAVRETNTAIQDRLAGHHPAGEKP